MAVSATTTSTLFHSSLKKNKPNKPLISYWLTWAMNACVGSKQWVCFLFWLLIQYTGAYWSGRQSVLSSDSLRFLSLFINPQSELHCQHGVITGRYGYLHFLPRQQCRGQKNGLLDFYVYMRVCDGVLNSTICPFITNTRREWPRISQAAGIMRNISDIFLPFSNKRIKYFFLPHNPISFYWTLRFSGKCVSSPS